MLYQLSNGTIMIHVNSLGAQLESLRHLETATEYMWQREAYAWSQCAPVLFPFVAKLYQDTAWIAGKEYHMKIHGFIQNMEAKSVVRTEDKISFYFHSDAGTLACYPYEFGLTVIFQLSDNTLIQRFRVENPGSNPMSFTIGAHPAFNCPLHPGECFEDYCLFIEDTAHVPLLNPDGTLEMDNPRAIPCKNGRIPLSHGLFRDDALVFTDLKTKKAALCHRDTHKGIEMTFTGMNYLGVWSPKHVDAPFVCLEPWMGLPNCKGEERDFSKKPGMICLNPGENHTTGFSVALLT